MITKIRVPARYDIGGGNIYAVAEFTLGLGPCGKVVRYLDFEDGPNFIKILQVHVDKTSKTFYYRHADLIGRIEIEEE